MAPRQSSTSQLDCTEKTKITRTWQKPRSPVSTPKLVESQWPMGRGRKKNDVCYSGGKDSDGLPHGRGTEKFPSGDVFSGRFCHGEKQGRGTWSFSDGSSLSGRFVGSELQGVGIYSFADGGRLEAHYEDGQLHGEAREYDCFGDLKFAGRFEDGTKHGQCTEVVDDYGGFLFGSVDTDGLWNGDGIAYVYPDSKTALFGKFADGSFCVGHQAVFHGSVNDCSTSSVGKVNRNGDTFHRCVSTETVLNSWPLVPDPYESLTVYVAPSRIPGAGEGLFARRNVQAGEILAYYNGIRLTHEEVDGRDWTANGNCISLDEDTVLDVPPAQSHTAVYCASLGHKANHSFEPNACYAPCDHPCFGRIKCVQAITDISEHDEITVDYDYHHETAGEEAPEWYLKAKQQLK